MDLLGMAVAKCLKEQKHLDAKVDPQILAMLIWSSAQLQMLSECLAKAILKEIRARIHECSPCSLSSIVWAFDELGIQRLKLMQKVGAVASLLIEQFESKEFLKFNWGFSGQVVRTTHGQKLQLLSMSAITRSQA